MEQQIETTKDASEATKTIVVKYGYLAFIGEFEYSRDAVLVPNQPVIIETDRGIELGHFLCYSGQKDGALSVCPKIIDRYLNESGSEYLKRNAGKAIRPATAQDRSEEQHIQSDATVKKKFCDRVAERLGLKMKVACVEHLFGGERIIFYFTAEGRIDFRELVRELAKEYQTRIELRQIGARDEARLLADYEICGRQCCCKNFLKTLRPVNMKMAKLQKATLDPSKVSGRCGRLRCCLRYEQRTYEELLAQLPTAGTLVQTPAGTGKIKDRIVLTQLVQVAFEDNRLITYPIEEITVVGPMDKVRTKTEQEVVEPPLTAKEAPEELTLPDDETGGERAMKPTEDKPADNGQGPRPGGESTPRRSRRNRGKKRKK